LQGKGPTADSGKEVALCVFSKLMWLYFGDAAFVHVARRYQPSADKFAEPSGGFWIKFVVEVHFITP
jgi:hypothetical protein